MSDVKLTLSVLQQVSDFLARLPEDQLLDIAEGRAKITFIAEGEDGPRPTRKARVARAEKPVVDMSDVRDELTSMPSREAARTRLGKMTVATLQNLARFVGMERVTSLKKTELVEAIADETVGTRLTSSAFHGYAG